jgi:hypothetical protein
MQQIAYIVQFDFSISNLFKIDTPPGSHIARQAAAKYQSRESGRSADFPHRVGRG